MIRYTRILKDDEDNISCINFYREVECEEGRNELCMVCNMNKYGLYPKCKEAINCKIGIDEES